MNITELLLILIIFAILLVIVVFLFLLTSLNNQNKSSGVGTKYIYQKRTFMNKFELNFYKALLPIVTPKGYLVFFKVNLNDFLTPPKGVVNFISTQNRAKEEFVDFVLFDKEAVQPVLAIKLEEAGSPTARIKNVFVEDALRIADIPLLYAPNTIDLEKKIDALLVNVSNSTPEAVEQA